MEESNVLKNQIIKRLGRHRLFFVSRDLERAKALFDLGVRNFFIVTNTPKSSKFAGHPNTIFIRSKTKLDTVDLLSSAQKKSIIKKNDFVMVFKNSALIEKICSQNEWRLLNPSASLSSEVEEKISQTKWLGALRKYLPEHRIEICKNLKWRWKKFILQFNRAHSGTGTMLIDSKDALERVQKKFPNREARISEYLSGPVFTNNNVCWDSDVFVGSINYQITGLWPFTDNPFSTIGNDWGLASRILTKKQINGYQKICRDVGKKLLKKGWKGLFGIDAVLNSKDGKFYLLEINARQPASANYESELQSRALSSKKFTTTLIAHTAALLDIKPGRHELAPVEDGSQLVQRVTHFVDKIDRPKIKNGSVSVLLYNNEKIGSDLARIQSPDSIMQDHNIFNDLGKEIIVGTLAAQKKLSLRADRAGALIIKNNCILLIHRFKYGREYYTIPGGTREENECPEDTAVREINEETGLNISLDLTRDPLTIKTQRAEKYFFVREFKGSIRLGGPEEIRNTPDNHYELEWVNLAELKNIPLLPHELKIKLIETTAQYV